MPNKRSNRTGLVLARGLLLKSQFYLLSAVCELSYLWLSLGAALLWVGLLVRVIFITLERKKDRRVTPDLRPSLSKRSKGNINNLLQALGILMTVIKVIWESLTSWVQKETPVERLFSRGRLRSRMERGWDLTSPSFSSSFLSVSVQTNKQINIVTCVTFGKCRLDLLIVPGPRVYFLCSSPLYINKKYKQAGLLTMTSMSLKSQTHIF